MYVCVRERECVCVRESVYVCVESERVLYKRESVCMCLFFFV